MEENIRWGILSTAKVAYRMADALHCASRSRLVAIASRDLDRAKAFATEKRVPKAYGSYEDLLDDPNVDIIYIALPNSLHCEWIAKAAEAGKHVLCEKPVVISLSEFDRIEAASAAYKVKIFDGLKHLYHPRTHRAVEMIRSNILGNIGVINCCFGFNLPLQHANIRLVPGLGGGALWDVGIYAVSLAIMLNPYGTPLETWATLVQGSMGVDITANGFIRFDNDCVANISCGFAFPYRFQRTMVIGRDGILQMDEPWNHSSTETPLLTVVTTNETTQIRSSPGDPFLYELQAVEASILNGIDPPLPRSKSRIILKSILAMYESAERRESISI